MSDFIFSKQNVDPKEIAKEIQSIYKDNLPNVKEYHGDWGSFGVSENLYNGFNSYENAEYIVAVIGGPVLMFRNNAFINEQGSSEGTIAIFERYIEGKMEWDQDLSGPFVIFIINKLTGEINFVTDLMAFIPVYLFESSSDIILSTHVSVLARFSNQSDEIDEISETDFILHGVVTYPYTFYKNIIQIAPASEYKIVNKLTEMKSHNYWLPNEKEESLSINKVATRLRESLLKYIKKIVTESTNVAQFISGGEDSRVLSATLKDIKRDSFIFLDQMNREGETAEKVANIYGAKFNLHTREKLHYLNILPSCSDLVGSGSQYHHAHTYGFHEKCNLRSYSAVFGGLFSDALLKGARIKRVKRTGKVPFIPEMKDENNSASDLIKCSIFNETALTKVTERRKAHLKYIQRFRSESAEEWFALWPSSMNMNIPNLHANRRLFRSYEPFMSNEIVKISAEVPQRWKLNRKLFHKMAKPLLKPTKWLMHGDGWYPYYSWVVKSVVYPCVLVNRKIGKKSGLIKGNQGPWADWKVITSGGNWLNNVNEYAHGAESLQSVLAKEDLFKTINSNELNTYQRLNFLQTLYLNTKE